MQKLTELELQFLKTLINIQTTNYKKYLNYSDYSVDPQIKQTFNKAAQNSLNDKNQLMNFLN